MQIQLCHDNSPANPPTFAIYYVFWFYPLYFFSFILSNLWYNDIAMHCFAAMGRSGPSVVESSKNDMLTSDSKVNAARPAGLGGVMFGIGEQVYATGFIPYVGKALNFLLLSWMFWYFAFQEALVFWQFSFFSPLGSYGVMAILFPLFVLTATGTEAEQVISTHRRWSGAELRKLPVFYAVDSLLKRAFCPSSHWNLKNKF